MTFNKTCIHNCTPSDKFDNSSRVKSIVKCHERNLIKFRRQYHTHLDTSHMKVNKHSIHNFSSHVLSPEGIAALSFRLDQHIP